MGRLYLKEILDSLRSYLKNNSFHIINYILIFL